MSAEWYFHDGTKVHGPLSPHQLAELAAHGSLRPDHRVRKGSDGKWHLASQVKGLTFASPGPPPPAIETAQTCPPPLPAHHTPTAQIIAEPVADQSSRGITVIQPVAIYRGPDTGYAGQAVQHFRRLSRPPMRPYFIASACVVAVIAIAALGVIVGRLSRSGDQISQPQVAQSNTLRSETAVAGNGNRLLPASPQAQAASEQSAPDDQEDRTRANDAYQRGMAAWSGGNKGNVDLAISCFTDAIRVRPDLIDAYRRRGTAYSYKCNFDQALADYSEAVRLNPALAETFFGRGCVYGCKALFSSSPTGDRENAIADYTQAILLDPNYARAYYNRGSLYKDKGESQAADADLAEAKRLGYVGPQSATQLASGTDNRTLTYWKRIPAIGAAGIPKAGADHAPTASETISSCEQSAQQIRSEPTLGVDLEVVRCANEFSNLLIEVAERIRKNNDPAELFGAFAEGYAEGQQGDLVTPMLEAREKQRELAAFRKRCEDTRRLFSETRAAMTAKYGVEFPAWSL